MGYGHQALWIISGNTTVPAGTGNPHQVDFNDTYPYKPAIILTSAIRTTGGGSVNAFISDVTTTGFKVNVSNDEPAVDIHWRAILDRQQAAHGNGTAATSDGA